MAIINAGTTPTLIGNVNPDDLVFNTGNSTAYIDTIQANVIQAPQSSAIPIRPGATVQWAGRPGLLYARDPTGGNPGLGITAQTGLPFPASAFFTAGQTVEINPLGFFVYAGIPALGNLIFTDTPASGVDRFGNVFQQGTAQYQLANTAIFVRLLNAGINFGDPANVFGAAVVETPALGGASGVPGLLITSPSNINAAGLNSQAAVGLVGESADGTHGPFNYAGSTQFGSANIQAAPYLMVGGKLSYAAGGVAGGALTPEGWHDTIPAGTNTLGNPKLQVKRLSENNMAYMRGLINAATTFPAGFQNVGTVPVGPYTPSFNSLVFCTANNGVAQPCGVDNAGNIFATLPAGLTSLNFQGSYALD